MQITMSGVWIGDAVTIDPWAGSMCCSTEESGVRVHIPLSTVLRLASVAEFEYQRKVLPNEMTWEEYCNSLYKLPKDH